MFVCHTTTHLLLYLGIALLHDISINSCPKSTIKATRGIVRHMLEGRRCQQYEESTNSAVTGSTGRWLRGVAI